MNPLTFRLLLRNELFMRDMTQVQLASKLKITPKVVNDWIRGRTELKEFAMVGVMVVLRGKPIPPWDEEKA